MSRNVALKVGLVAVLLGVAIAGEYSAAVRPASHWFVLVMLAFGTVNVLFTPPGTAVVRATAIGATLAVLAWPAALSGVLTWIVWLVWPPAFMVAWALARESPASPATDVDWRAADTRPRIAMASLIGAVAIATVAYRLIVAGGLQQTAALFIGIPAILAIVVVVGVSPRSAIGVACKAVTVGLLVSLIFLGEGVLCVLVSAPLFYAVAIVIAALRDRVRGRRDPRATTMSCLVLLATLPMSLEGVSPTTTFSRDESVAVTRVVRESAANIGHALFQPPRFDRTLPILLRAGFPRPVAARIDDGVDGMRWIVQLRGGEMRITGMEPRTGNLTLSLEDARPGYVRWRAVSDDSHMTHFLAWRDIVVTWEPVDGETTAVTWTLGYRRGLDPAWYFGPMERYAARLAAGYLIDAIATP